MIKLLIYHLKTLFDFKTKVIFGVLFLINLTLIVHTASIFTPTIEALLFQEVFRINYHLDTLFFMQLSIVLFLILLTIQLTFNHQSLTILVIRMGRLKTYLSQVVVYLCIGLIYSLSLLLLSFIVLKQTPYYHSMFLKPLMQETILFSLYYGCLIYVLGQLFKNYYVLLSLFMVFFFSTIIIDPNILLNDITLGHLLFQVVFPSIHYIEQHFILINTALSLLIVTLLLTLIGIYHFITTDIK